MNDPPATAIHSYRPMGSERARSGQSSCVLGLFAKWPEPGAVKTRLAAASSPEWAARVAMAFLRDLLSRLAAIEARRLLVFAPVGREASFTELAGEPFLLAAQTGGSLGERLAAFATSQLQAGATRIVLLGTDAPTVPTDYVRQAFHELERADIVLGPATDGGYYLVGCARRLPPIFDGISWSSRTVLADTVARLTDSSWRLALLPPWYDVDTLDDWQMLQGHLAALRRAGFDPEVPCTEELARQPLAPRPNG